MSDSGSADELSTQLSKLDRGPLPDICRNKHQGNTESELANVRVHSQKSVDRMRIIKYAEYMGGYGITFKEVCSALDLKPQTASARLAELKADVELEAKGIRRDGCGVFVRTKGQLKLIPA
jgi:hypothetical protein